MEFFIPSLLLFLVSIGITFTIAPRFTPLVVAILSIGFLTLGVYQHYKMFASEYRLSTWQQGLKVYAPALMIGAIIIFIIYAILAFFTKGAVPIPSIPNITGPSENSATNQVMESLNKIGNAFTNTTNTVINKVNNIINKGNNNGSNNTALKNNKGNGNTNKKNGNNLSRSFLETI
jgi:predicted PurR-regulated permease PerM